jgi:DNA-binding winged helix-turn-helix (wHTH) protein
MELDAELRMGFRLGDWEIRPIEGLVKGAQEAHHMQPKTMDVLVCLAALPGQVITRDELISRVWGATAVTDEPLTRCIHEIRRCLGDQRDHPAYIKTIPKRGYQLIAPVLEPGVPATPISGRRANNLFWQVTRQQVLWVGLIYAILAWLFTELASFAELRAIAGLVPPDWLLPLLVVLVLAGFPVAIFYAWVRQIRFDSAGRLVDGGGHFPGVLTLLWSRRGIDIVLVTVVMAVLAGYALDILPRANRGEMPQAAFRVAALPFGTHVVENNLLMGCQNPIWDK